MVQRRQRNRRQNKRGGSNVEETNTNVEAEETFIGGENAEVPAPEPEEELQLGGEEMNAEEMLESFKGGESEPATLEGGSRRRRRNSRRTRKNNNSRRRNNNSRRQQKQQKQQQKNKSKRNNRKGGKRVGVVETAMAPFGLVAIQHMATKMLKNKSKKNKKSKK